MINKLSTKFNTTLLCKIALVSVSWYYNYKHIVLLQQTKEDKERQDLQLIKEISLCSKQKYWYRMITMLLRNKSIVMNHKKVLRIMKKYGLLAKIRRPNPYKQIMKVTQEHRTAGNKLNREFKWSSPYCKIWTDITYVKFKWKWTYLSIVKDMITWEILWESISDNLWLWVVYNTLDKLKEKYRNWELKWSLFHSDQWFHYTHPSFWENIKKLWCIQSMSRKWKCIDNAPTESFFWHMKDEIDVSECETFEELEKYIENYIFDYNNNRPQWNKKKMTPVKYRNHLLSS